LRFFVTELLKEAEGEAIEWRLHEQQALWDLAFLRKLADLWVSGWTEISSVLDEKMAQLRGKVCKSFEISTSH
jgi:hypothetical protein